MCLFVTISCTSQKGQVASKTDDTSKAKAVYNHAYNENYDADTTEYIIANAQDAFVLMDPFEGNAHVAIAEIKANGNTVVGYISIGTGENWRSDFEDLKPFLIDKQWKEWPGEFYIKETTTGVIDVMKARIDQLADWGCDWVEFDNMDWASYNETRAKYGITVTEEEGVAYFQELCDYAHSKGMKCMAKNFVANASEFDGALYESYKKEKNWWYQSGAQSFLDAGKIVIINHYNEKNCSQVYADYKEIYNNNLSFICEDSKLKKYVHFNE